MAGSQSASPRPVSPSRPKRRFTLAQANKSLALVSRIVSDIVHTHQSVTELHEKLETTKVAREQKPLQDRLESENRHLQEYVDELADVGCELKDFQTGLVDFIGRHQGRDVYLCWKLGETEIQYWHELHTGFAGRQTVSSLEESA
ncbi:MAG TPA: DUF2203 domain-containing protein [Tepidisphaeraceae bacterium]|jgi:hypothetical protein|nr:DUF2203 domain-containing protein [Tepidisphaeraceae bacterium]